MPAEDVKDGYYLQPAMMTAAGTHGPLLAGLPAGVAAVAGVVQGLLIHEHIAWAYGVKLSDDRRSSVHVQASELLGLMVSDDDRPLTDRREPGLRLAGNCRHYTVLAVAMLRAQGIPARARCGFGGYFRTGGFEDHWVVEYRDEAASRWKLADAQVDDVQRPLFDIAFDLMDVPRDQFLVAGEAWLRYRAGDADPDRFGLSLVNEGGGWWIRGKHSWQCGRAEQHGDAALGCLGDHAARGRADRRRAAGLVRPAGRADPRS